MNTTQFKINATPPAIERIREFILDAANPETKLRIYVQGGGCAGFSYGFSLDADKSEDDFLQPIGDGVSVIVDAASAQYLHGATINYIEEFLRKELVIDNPNATHMCGCGSSFGV